MVTTHHPTVDQTILNETLIRDFAVDNVVGSATIVRYTVKWMLDNALKTLPSQFGNYIKCLAYKIRLF